ncbi:unnamed protein product [Brachionus calyciflorus]|uniref:Uncharacterized protein n=1 Tax=Brachionus calyciflorus TaxID=104777 RepID=A0A813WL86_9BILA|nr:unnamed protein product [Brachionus calyciflorus]
MWIKIAKSVILLIIQIIIFSKKCDQHVIRLFNSYHFVQLNSEIFEPKNSQSFQRGINGYDHLIITDDHCSFQKNSILKNPNTDPISSNFNFNSHPILYSNENNRLSFLLSISFDSITDIETYKNFLGYEIKFRNFDNLINCVKIMPDKNALGKFRRMELVIKDPKFVTQKNKDYTFYFGEISVHILVKCTNDTEYCKETFIHSNELDVGIKSKNSSVDTSIQFNTDVCRGDFNQYTCILRYKSQINEDYFILIQPGTDQFEYIKGNLNRLIIKNNDSIELRGDEMWPNNLIYKLFQTQSQIFYLGEFKNPTEKNKCYNDMFKRYCDCNNKCTSCSSLYGNNEIIRAVVLEEEMESKHCSNYIYSAYSFERLSIEKTFLNEELNKTKNIFNRKNLLREQKPFYEFNLDFVPRLCLAINPKISQEFSVSFHLNNVNSAPMTNLFNIKHYKITWYSIESNNLKMDSNQLYDIDIYQLFDKTVNLNQMPIELNLNRHNLNKKYLIEFFLEPNNTVCPKSNMCIDEYTKNNHIQCIDRDYCTKYFYFLQINEIVPFFSCEQNENNRFSKMVSYNLDGETNLLSSESNNDQSKILFYAAKVPVYFKSNNLKLPLYFINFNILKTSFSSKSQIIILVIFGCFVPIILFSIFLFLYYQAIMFDQNHLDHLGDHLVKEGHFISMLLFNVNLSNYYFGLI